MAMAQEAIKRLTIVATKTGVDEATASLNKLGDAHQNVAVKSETSNRATLSAEQAFAKLERRYIETVRQQQEYARVQAQVNAAVAQNPALIERGNTVLAAAASRINAVHAANQNVAKSTGLASYEMVNLGRQGADVFTQLASGQSLFMTAVQQGPQVLDIFATSQVKFSDVVKSGVGWLGRFAMSAAGVATGVLAIGGAAIFAASQFSRASTTIEQALEEQNRLLKEGKALLDARTSAEARAQLQSKDQTQFETERNRLDLQVKLNQAMEEAANISRRRATRPTEVPGEMGIAPTAFAALPDAGLDKMTAAFERLKAAQDANLPGLKDYNAELAKIGLAHPELALIIQDMLKAGEAGLQLENAAQRAKALSDAMAGIATNAQMAAVGLGSVAQFQANNLLADQAAAATERQAQATLRLAQIYPGVTIEIAKQLETLRLQENIARARTVEERAAAEAALQYAQNLTIAKNASEAARLSAAQRAVTEQNARNASAQMIQSAQSQASVDSADSPWEANRIAAAQKYRDVLNDQVFKDNPDLARQTAAATAAAAQSAGEHRVVAQEQAQAEQDAARAASDRASENAKAAQEAEREAREIARIRAEWERIRELMKFVPFYQNAPGGAYKMGKNLFESNQGGYSQFNPEGYTSTVSVATQQSLSGSSYTDPWSEYYATLAGGLGKTGKGMSTSLGGGPGLDTDKIASLERLIALMSKEQQIGATQSLIQELTQRTPSLERDESINRLTQSLNQLREATEANTDALRITTDPLISQGHDYLNNLKIGYYKAASGFDGIARGGIPGVDSIPFHAMVQQGERITITPPGRAANSNVSTSNDNSKNVTQYITQNIGIAGVARDPRTARQMAQGFIAAAARAVG